jgi:hypothetical protein
MITRKKNGPKRIGFVSTRIRGTDGVSLEIEKWAAVLEAMGHRCFYIAGLCDDRPPERRHIIPEAHFRHPEIEVQQSCRIGAQYLSYRRVAEEMQSLLSAPHLVSHGLDPERCFATV